jgi:DNA-directed RNA polymerase subunit omega
MAPVPIDELLKQCRSIYKLVVIAAKRAKELSEGTPKFVETDSKRVTSIALEEIRQGKVFYKSEDEEAEAKEAGGGTGKARKRAAKEPVGRGERKKKRASPH